MTQASELTNTLIETAGVQATFFICLLLERFFSSTEKLLEGE